MLSQQAAGCPLPPTSPAPRIAAPLLATQLPAV